MEDMLALARKIDVFAGLDETDLSAIAELAVPVTVPEGIVIFAEDGPGDAVYVVVSGQVRIAKGKGLLPRQYQRFLATLGPGDVFGEMSLILHEPRSAAAVAFSPCELYKIPAIALEELLASRGKAAWTLMENLLRMLCARVRRMDDALVGLERRAKDSSVGANDVADLRENLFGRGFRT